jgi:hypothetical protein
VGGCSLAVVLLAVLSVGLAVALVKVWIAGARRRVLVTIVSTAAGLALLTVVGGVPDRYFEWARELSTQLLSTHEPYDRVMSLLVFWAATALMATAHFDNAAASVILTVGYVAVAIYALSKLFAEEQQVVSLNEEARSELQRHLSRMEGRVDLMRSISTPDPFTRGAAEAGIRNDLQQALACCQRLSVRP